MISVKVKFRPSTVVGKEGVIYYQIIQNRIVRQLTTNYRIFSEEWDESNARLIIGNTPRSNHLLSLKSCIDWDMKRIQMIINQLTERNIPFSTNDIITAFQRQADEQSLFNFMGNVITQLKKIGKLRTAETYTATLRSFMRFRNDTDVLLDDITPELIEMYEAYLQNNGVVRNTSSFYMRILRAVYNRAVEKEFVKQRNPFKNVYTGVDKTAKRALPLSTIRRIKNLDLTRLPKLEFARDMFLFSFYTRGMSFIDMAFLKKTDLQNGYLKYRRRKTKQQLFIRWEKCMQEILDKHNAPESPYLLPIIKVAEQNERKQYGNALREVNNKLKEIAKTICLQIPLSTYVARHSWASIARSKNIPISVISEGMGHDSEMTTQIYLSSLDSSAIDHANSLILKDLK